MSVFVSNLDDFISPGLVCVNPAIIGKAGESDGKEDAANKGKSVSLQEESDQMITTAPVLGYEDESSSNPLNILGFHKEPNLIKPTISGKNNQKIATVSLNDCLACSGCVTSAETVLIEQQSYSKLSKDDIIRRKVQVQRQVLEARRLNKKLALPEYESEVKDTSLTRSTGRLYDDRVSQRSLKSSLSGLYDRFMESKRTI